MNKLILILLPCAYFTFCNAQTWSQLTDFPGTQRDDGASFVVDNKAYCFSGLEVGWQCTGNGFVFDGSSETWTGISSLPSGNERQYATGFSFNHNGYVLGGLNCSGACLKDFWKYTVSTNSWLALSDFPGQGRQGMSNFIINDKLYIIGGRIADNSTINEVWEFNFTTSIWTQKNNLPFAGMWRGAAFSIDTIGYVCYGMNNTVSGSFNHLIYQYNHITDNWTIVPNIVLPARNYIGCAVTNNKACLYGGQDSMNVVTNDIKLFNPIDTSLTTYLGLPTIGRKGAMTFVLYDVFYITTGLDATQNRIKETWKNDAFVGVKKNMELFNELNIYPNPSSHKLYVDLSNHKFSTITLINQLGQIVFEEKVENQILEINTSQYTNGIYYLSIQSRDLSMTNKVIISH